MLSYFILFHYEFKFINFKLFRLHKSLILLKTQILILCWEFILDQAKHALNACLAFSHTHFKYVHSCFRHMFHDAML